MRSRSSGLQRELSQLARLSVTTRMRVGSYSWGSAASAAPLVTNRRPVLALESGRLGRIPGIGTCGQCPWVVSRCRNLQAVLVEES